MSSSKLLKILYVLGSLIFLAMYGVAAFTMFKMQTEINRKRTESARKKRWSGDRDREPETETKTEPEHEINFQPEPEQNEKEAAIA